MVHSSIPVKWSRRTFANLCKWRTNELPVIGYTSSLLPPYHYIMHKCLISLTLQRKKNSVIMSAVFVFQTNSLITKFNTTYVELILHPSQHPFIVYALKISIKLVIPLHATKQALFTEWHKTTQWTQNNVINNKRTNIHFIATPSFTLYAMGDSNLGKWNSFEV